MDQQDESDFNRLLPIEMQRKLFSYLSFQDNINARQVSYNWWNLVDENLSFNVSLTNETLTHVVNLNRSIENLTVVNLTKDISSEFIYETKVNHLVLGEWIKSKSKTCVVTQNNILTLLTTLNDLQSLTIFVGQLNLQNLSLFKLITLPCATKLDIVVRRVDEMKIFISVLKLNLQVLEWLRIDWDKIYLNSLEKMLPLYKEIYNFVASHANTLKFLHLILPFHWTNRRNSRSSRQDPNLLEILEKLKKVQLTQVTLRGLPMEGSSTFNLGISLLNFQQSLTHVYLYDLKVGYYYKLEPLFKNCGSTLILVSIEGASMEVHSYGQFSCTLIKSCTKLETLIINNSQITQLLHISDLPKTLQILSLKMPIDGTIVYPWIAKNLFSLKELTIRPTLWELNAVLDMENFKNFLRLPSLIKLNLSNGLFRSQEILQFVDTTEGLNAVSASYCWPDLVNVYVLIDRSVYKHLY